MNTGLFENYDEQSYHRHPALSASGAKILATQTPADYQHYLHEFTPTPAMNDGTAVHSLVLGTGPEMVVVQKKNRSGELEDAYDYTSTKYSEQHTAEIIAAGKTPILRRKLEPIKAMAAAIHEHPLARALLCDEGGKSEVSAFWNDATTGVPMRARFDRLRQPDATGRVIVPDLKTSSALKNLREFVRQAANLDYPVQAAFYEDAIVATGYGQSAEFLWVVVESTPPHKVAVVGLNADDRKAGRALMERAARLYRECTETGRWPGIPEEVHYVDLPAWWRIGVEELTA